MSTNNDNPSNPVPGAPGTPAPGGNENVADNLTLEEINTSLGTNYKDKATALKAIKDTKNYVGGLGQKVNELESKINSPVPDKTTIDKVSALEKDLFYTKNPQYEPYRKIIEKMGGNPSEVIATEEFKVVFDKAKGFDEIQSKKSVLESQSRLGLPNDKVKSSQDLMNESSKLAQSGDAAGAHRAYQGAKSEALGAVIDAYGLDK